tara:strand:- start:990 stop:1358 length:369 start_codon:yes stop_codon:yes gene_type:complete
MSSIRLKNIRIFAHHGCLTEEEKIGSDYLVNLKVSADLSKAAQTDALSDTVDYVQLNHIVKTEMAKRSKLLEHVGQRIIDRIFKELAIVTEVRVSVAKVNPPIGGDVASVSVTMHGQREIAK